MTPDEQMTEIRTNMAQLTVSVLHLTTYIEDAHESAKKAFELVAKMAAAVNVVADAMRSHETRISALEKPLGSV